MTGLLHQASGRWAVRLLALPAGWLVLTYGAGMAWDGGGHLFLAAIFWLCLLAIVYGADAALDFALSFAPPAAPARPAFAGTVPPLSAARQAKVRKLQAAMAEAGVFAPDVPAPELAFAALAVERQRVDWLSVIGALAEADYYQPDCAPARWSANMFHDHIPANWDNPPPGKVLAYLWEDETIVFSWVASGSMAVLGKAEGKSTPWHIMTEPMLPIFAKAGIFPR